MLGCSNEALLKVGKPTNRGRSPGTTIVVGVLEPRLSLKFWNHNRGGSPGTMMVMLVGVQQYRHSDNTTV